MRCKTLMLALLLLCALGCSSSSPQPAAVAPGGSPDLRRLMHDAAASGLLCERLRGKFISLPEEGGPEGAAAAMAPNVGSLWLQSCRSSAGKEQLQLDVSGIGWMWVDQRQHGFRVQQYVYFNVVARLRGVLDLGYDPQRRLASIWFSPSRIDDVVVTPLGELNAKPETLLADFISITPIALAIPGIARQAAAEEGAERFRTRLGRGATVTFSLTTQQYDMSLGHLPRGVVPRHPFNAAPPWWVNERHHLRPGGLHVVGPFPAAPARVETVIERGAGPRLRAVCEHELVQALSAVARPAGPQRIAPLNPRAVFQQLPAGPGRTTTAVNPPCRWYLTAAAGGPQPAMLAWLVSPADPAAAPALPGAPSPGPARPGSAPPGSAPPGSAPPGSAPSVLARVTLLEVSVAARKSSGEPWDVALIGSNAPDPAVTYRQLGTRDNVFFATTDTHRAIANAMLPHPVELTEANPALFIVVDRDIADHDLVGTATLRPTDVQRGREITLPVVDREGRRTGSVRLRVEVLRR